MGRRKLGKTNLEVVPVGFATLAAAQQTAIDNAKEVLNAALNAGVNFIDTARSWSKSEEQVGQYIAHRRDEYYLAAKSMKRSGVEIAEDIRQSLIAMRTDHIDLYQIQNLRTREELQEVLSPHGALFALKAARQAGSIRHIGITGYEIPILLEALLTDEFETVQIPFNIVEQDAIKLLFPLAREMNIGVIGMKPLGGGALHNANLALRFVLEHENIAVTVSGMDEVWQVKENLGAIRKFHPLLEDEREALMRLVDTAGRRFCRRCGLCVPCPEDINIPRIFLSYLQYTRQGARRLLPAELAYMQTKSAACTGCGLCESRCPYHLEIRERLQMIKKDLG
ncbi:TPA: aldo/keto reductase [Candidatus Sumerlaeota bacterium]|nr:aldo/keto reductase [Candidatus Sumerlaeota bacterium]